jgi:hypothetical protein
VRRDFANTHSYSNAYACVTNTYGNRNSHCHTYGDTYAQSHTTKASSDTASSADAAVNPYSQ